MNNGNEIIGIDIDIKKRHNLDFVIPEQMKMQYGSYYPVTENFSMIWDDINNIDRYNYATENIDTIYHLAASADIEKSLIDTSWDIKNNVMGTHSILEMMRKKDIKDIVFTSSSAVYGISPEIPTKEETSYMKPINLYGASKISGEAFMHAYNNVYGIKAWMFRLAQIVGKREHRGVIFDLVKKLNDNQHELKILGDGNQQKSYLYVSDCVNGLIDIYKHDNNKSVEAYNIGNTTTIKVKDLAKLVCEEIGVKPHFTFAGGDRGWIGDTPYCILSIKKALDTGWKPEYNCEEAIKKTVQYFFDGGKK